MKALYIDVETTGTQFWKHGIHSISGIIDIDGEIKEEFDFEVQPHPDAKIDDEALKVGGVKIEDFVFYPKMDVVHKQLTVILDKYVDRYDKMDKFHFIGYNASFDNDFLRAFFVQNNDLYFGSLFYSDNIDVMALAGEQLKHIRHTMDDFKLHTVAAKLGIEVDKSKLHKSIYDVHITRQMHYAIRQKTEKRQKIYLVLDGKKITIGCFYDEQNAINFQAIAPDRTIQLCEIL